MAELGKRTAGSSEHTSFCEKGGTDAATEIEKGKIFLFYIAIDLFCIGIAGSIIEKIYRVSRECSLQRLNDLSTFHGRQIQGRGIYFIAGGIDHGRHYYTDAKDTVRSTVFQDGFPETGAGAYNVIFIFGKLSRFVEDGSAGNVYQISLYSILMPVHDNDVVAVHPYLKTVRLTSDAVGFSDTAVHDEFPFDQFVYKSRYGCLAELRLFGKVCSGYSGTGIDGSIEPFHIRVLNNLLIDKFHSFFSSPIL